jgi:hypothetical protein
LLITFHPTRLAVHGARFRQKFTLEDDIGPHASSLEASRRVTNGIPLGCPRFLPLHTVNCVQTLKVFKFDIGDPLHSYGKFYIFIPVITIVCVTVSGYAQMKADLGAEQENKQNRKKSMWQKQKGSVKGSSTDGGGGVRAPEAAYGGAGAGGAGGAGAGATTTEITAFNSTTVTAQPAAAAAGYVLATGGEQQQGADEIQAN